MKHFYNTICTGNDRIFKNKNIWLHFSFTNVTTKPHFSVSTAFPPFSKFSMKKYKRGIKKKSLIVSHFDNKND